MTTPSHFHSTRRYGKSTWIPLKQESLQPGREASNYHAYIMVFHSSTFQESFSQSLTFVAIEMRHHDAAVSIQFFHILLNSRYYVFDTVMKGIGIRSHKAWQRRLKSSSRGGLKTAAQLLASIVAVTMTFNMFIVHSDIQSVSTRTNQKVYKFFDAGRSYRDLNFSCPVPWVCIFSFLF